MRVRLRDAYTPAELQVIYPRPHQHDRWPDHRLRVDVTVQIARFLHPGGGTIADLSCGDAAIANALNADRVILGDLAEGYEHHGPIEQTIDRIPRVDLFVCCETLEHLDDPDRVLWKIRQRANTLVVSTPDGEQTGHNPEHYWGWDANGVYDMLTTAGFTPVVRTLLHLTQPAAAYQIWGCR